MDWYLLSVILFFAVIGIVLYTNRKRVSVQYCLLFMFRTKRFRNLIDRIANVSPKFWKIISTLAILACFYYMLDGVYLLLMNSREIILGKVTQPGLQLVLPSITSTASSGPGYMLIPFWFWLITIACILVPHELSHGIIARAEKIRLESVGLLLLAIFPGAFVEPDEKQLKKSSVIKKLRVFAAGSGANFLVAGFMLLLISSVVWPAFAGTGIEIISVNQTSPAHLAGIASNMTLMQVDGKTISTTYQEYLSGSGYLSDELGKVSLGQTLTFVSSDNQQYNVNVTELNGRPYIGVIYKPVFKTDSGLFFSSLMPLMTMIWLFSFAVGLFNILPLYPLDGGLMVEALTERYFKKRSKMIVKIVSGIMFLIILYNFFGPSIRLG